METAVKEACLHAKNRTNRTDLDIASKSGLSESTVRTFFSEKSKNPSLNTAGHICRALGVSLDELFGIQPHRLMEDRSAKTLFSAQSHEIAQLQTQNIWLRRLVAGLLALSLIMAVAMLGYLICFDLSSPDYGLFRG